MYRRETPPVDVNEPDLYDTAELWCSGQYVVVERQDGQRDKIPVVPASEAFVRYLGLRDKMLKVRRENGGYYSEHEEPIIEALDECWLNLTEDELAYIRAQGSWRFA